MDDCRLMIEKSKPEVGSQNEDVNPQTNESGARPVVRLPRA